MVRLIARNDAAYLSINGGLTHTAAPPRNGVELQEASKPLPLDETVWSVPGSASTEVDEASTTKETAREKAPVPSTQGGSPTVLRETPPTTIMEEKTTLLDTPSVPVAVDPAATYRERFLSLLPPGPQREAWSQVWTYNDRYSQNRVDLPYPYAGDKAGRVEQNDLETVVRGLRALGADQEARGMLENWLSLGERYTALPGSNQLSELGRSGMPALSRLLLEEAEHHPDPEFLARAYQVVSDDHQHSWSDRYFKLTSGNGLNRFCDVDYSHDASLEESGGQKNQVRFDGDPAPYNPVDLNAALYRTERDLATMARQMAARGQDVQDWERRAEEWEQKAAVRKETMMERLWDPDKGLFVDLNFRTNERSEVSCLAAFSVLDAGMLDPADAREKKRLDKLVGSLDAFFESPDQKLPVWDTTSKRPADPADVLMVVRGLERYGFEEQAERLKEGLRSHFKSQPAAAEPRALSAHALVENEGRWGQRSEDLQSWLTPKGLQRLRQLHGQMVGGEGTPKLEASEAGRIDRRLREVHSSLLKPAIVRDLHQRGLSREVFGLEFDGDAGRLTQVSSGQQLVDVGQKLQVGPASVDLGVQGADVEQIGEGALRVTRNGTSLTFIHSQDHLLIGDRAYALESFGDPPSLKLPNDIVSAFHTAGGNPQMEEFYHQNREWIAVEKGPVSAVTDLPGRGGWRGMFDTVGRNWEQLTIEPSVTSHDTAVQFFNPAAVPSLGIFKTQFNWDTMFMAKGMQLQGQDSVVAGMTDNLLYILKTVGRVPNAARSVYLNKSQPPFLPSLVRMSEPIRARQFGEKATGQWVKEAYGLMAGDFRDFWRESGERGIDEIDGEKVCLSRWGGPNHKFAMDESGFDTTSRFDGKTKDLVPPDLNAFLWGYAKDMEAIALRLRDKAQKDSNAREVLQYSSEAAYWDSMAQKIKRDVIKYCWDAEDGMFRDYRFQGEDKGLQRQEDNLSAVVAPLWVGMLDPNIPEEKEMIERSLDAVSRFEKEHGLAATAEDYGHPEMQWNGPSGWSPLHMMAIEAEVRYGRYEEASRHTAKWLDTIDKVFNRDGVILERYDVVQGDHPPVQKGRYEETQGEGPGFGWTNASVPWALLEVVGGVRLHRDPALPTVMNVIPHIPAALEGKELAMNFSDPGGGQSWNVLHNYSSKESTYQFGLQGEFKDVPLVNVVTPPLPAGLVPQAAEETPPYSLKQERLDDGRVRYRLMFENLKGPQSLDIKFAPQPSN